MDATQTFIADFAEIEQPVYDAFEPWMIGRLIEITTEARDSYRTGFQAVRSRGGRLTRYSQPTVTKVESMFFWLDGEKFSVPCREFPSATRFKIRVVDPQRDPEMTLQWEQLRALWKSNRDGTTNVDVSFRTEVGQRRRPQGRAARLVRGRR